MEQHEIKWGPAPGEEPYYALVEGMSAYVNDPVGYAMDVLDMKPTGQQSDALMAIANDPRNKGVACSGHGVGKTRTEAVAAHWFMDTRWKANVLVTAPVKTQLSDLFWKELVFLLLRKPKEIRDLFDRTQDSYFHRAFREEWALRARTARKDKPEALQGRHNPHLLVLCDEGCGIEDVLYEVLEGAMTQGDNKLWVFTNPTKPGGYVYNATKDKEHFASFTFSSLDSPLYNKKQAESIAARYGRESDIYKVRVLGEFPSGDPNQMFPLALIESCFLVEIKEEFQRPVVWAVDVAREGDDETVLAKRHGMKVLPLTGWFNTTLDQTRKRIIREYDNCKPSERPERIIIDATPMGAGLCDELEALGYPVVRFNPGWTSSDPTRWANAKAELFDDVKLMMQRGRIQLPKFDIHGEIDNDLHGQFTTITFEVDPHNGVLRITPKKSTKNPARKSPDRPEAVIYLFWDMECRMANYDDDEQRDFLGNPIMPRRSAYAYDEFKDAERKLGYDPRVIL
jgi:hypothetical protein